MHSEVTIDGELIVVSVLAFNFDDLSSKPYILVCQIRRLGVF